MRNFIYRLYDFGITRYGISFPYRGDAVVFVFPWARTRREARFLSIGFGSAFSSLKEMNDAWEDYWKAEEKSLMQPYEVY